MPRLKLTRASDITPRAAPWRHYPHCGNPDCGQIIESASPTETLIVRGYHVPHTGDYHGADCPWCGTDLHRTDRVPAMP